MRFRVPQFLGIEDKIFGPLSFKQFVYLAGGAGIVVVIWYFVQNLFWTALISLPIVMLTIALAFYEINQKPFIFIVEAFLKYIFGSRMYIWKKQPPQTVRKDGFETLPPKEETHAMFDTQRLSNSKLKDLEWNVGVAGTTQAPEKTNPPQQTDGNNTSAL